MRKSNFGSSSRQSILKPKNSDYTPNTRHSSGLKKMRVSSEGNMRLSQASARFTPNKNMSKLPTPIRSLTSNTLAPPPSASRQSTDSVRNSSMGAKNRKETRPISDPAFKSECIDKILEFLMCNGYEHQIGRRTLLNPTTKDFTNIFTFIYRHFDPSFTLPHKFEEHIPNLMKLYRYPGQLSKSTFISVGSRHTWPVVLAMLAWMIDSVNIWSSTDGFATAFPTDFEIDSIITQKRVMKYFDYYHCQSSEELSNHFEEYHHTVEELYEVRSQDIIGLQQHDEKLDEEIAIASNGPERLELLGTQYQQLMNDRDKMISYNKDLQVRLTAKDTDREQFQAKLDEFKLELLHVSEELARLETVKEEQAYSIGELARIKNHAKDVATLISQLQVQGKELDSQTWSLEMTLGKSQKDLSDKVSNYNTLIRQLNLGKEMEIAATNIAESVHYWKNNLLGDLYECKKKAKHSAYDSKNENARKQEELSRIEENLKEKKNRVSIAESKVRRLDEDITMTKNEIVEEEKEMQQEIERLHQQVVDARKGHKTSLYQKQFALDKAKAELETAKQEGKERMRSGAQFIVKVCAVLQEDLKETNGIASKFHQDVKQSCKQLLLKVKEISKQNE